MMVHPSRRQRALLVALYLLLLWPVASLINGWQWALLIPVWLVALSFSWHALVWRPFELVWDGQWLTWQGSRYQLDPRSRILPGVLRLVLCPEPVDDQPMGAAAQMSPPLWIFSDALLPEHYRQLARAIHFLPIRR
ncbi:protein YgfX [Aeromonas cavernicola]|uniref:Toxin CptA n=1 Tax=Aeromonas cavernicola TaxID=1006623 RepID=A0A2H9U6N5_9GAMM|nr:protein YgfX [Aeromonas cavernicola]PJG59671.1 hypothetical protein CUC53_06140 [Aeromonas cavernicola]